MNGILLHRRHLKNSGVHCESGENEFSGVWALRSVASKCRLGHYGSRELLGVTREKQNSHLASRPVIRACSRGARRCTNLLRVYNC